MFLKTKCAGMRRAISDQAPGTRHRAGSRGFWIGTGVVAAGLVLAAQTTPDEDYARRRAALLQQAGDALIVLVGAGPTNLVEFKQTENFFYLTGWEEPGAFLVLDGKAAPGARAILYVPPRNPAQEQWAGRRLAPAEAQIATGIDRVALTNALLGDLTAATDRSPAAVYMELPSAEADSAFGPFAHTLSLKTQLAERSFRVAFKDVRPLIADQRTVKSDAELALLERAAAISGEAHAAAIRAARPGMFEYEIEAIVESVFRRNGAERPAYASIIGSGPNATVLHYDRNTRRIGAADLIVMDAAAEFHGYAADITRTIPASGRYTPPQREIYDIVYGAQEAAIAQVKPGATTTRTGAIDRAAREFIRSKSAPKFFTPGNEGLTLDKFFIHGTSHFIGLNVHDVGDISKPLTPGMVITVEPGLYFPADDARVAPEYRGIGVRVEDDFVVTPGGARELVAGVPRRAEDIERLMGSRVPSNWPAVPP